MIKIIILIMAIAMMTTKCGAASSGPDTTLPAISADTQTTESDAECEPVDDITIIED